MSCTATMRAARLNAHLMFVALSHTWLPLTLPCDADSAVHGVTTRICDKKAIATDLVCPPPHSPTLCSATLQWSYWTARTSARCHQQGAHHTQAHWDHVLLCNVNMCAGKRAVTCSKRPTLHLAI
jgi:hypothetical protein